jgi:serine protease SohB
MLRQRVTGWRKLRQWSRGKRAEARAKGKGGEDEACRGYVIRFQGDLRATQVDSLREEISAILSLARPGKDKVLVAIESGGGLVAAYGLAAAQLARVRDSGVELTVTVDRVAASGGYLMAAVANRIVAAPFAIVGSIGVVAQIPNVHRLLKRHDVDIELLTAGQFKRTLTVLGKNTPEGRAKFQQELEETHQLFKSYLHRYRPQLDLDILATGEHWYGEQALALQLVDDLKTSDEVILDWVREHDVYEVSFQERKPLGKRITLAVEQGLDHILHGRTPVGG